MKHLPDNVPWAALKNAVSQIGGRLFLSLARLAVMVIIVRYAGAERFGEYSLVLSLLLVAEWLVDFGMNDITVRNICREYEARRRILSALFLIKLAQIAIACVLFVGLLYVMGYPAGIIRAGIIGAFSLVFYGGVLLYRTVFRVHMVMERDVLAEVVGVAVMVPLVWIFCANGASVEVLVGCYLVSRVVFFLIAFAWGRRFLPLHDMRFGVAEIGVVCRQALPLGILGLLVAAYDALAPVMLSKLTDMHSVALFTAALRFVLPVIIVIQALGSALYPLLASYWKKDDDRFRGVQQSALESGFLIACLLFCIINAGAGFLMALVGPELSGAADVLRLLSWVILARALVTVMSPLIIISGRQAGALWLTAASLSCKLLLLLWLIPTYGVYGAVSGYLAAEFLISMLPVILLSQHFAGVRLDWVPVCKTGAAVLLALGACLWTGWYGSLSGAALACLVYITSAFAFGAVSPARLGALRDSVKNRLGGPKVAGQY